MDYLSGVGVSVGSCIERARLPAKMLDTPDLYIDESKFWNLAQNLALREDCLDWGYRAGCQLDFAVLGDFGTSLLRQPNLKAALEKFVAAVHGEASQACVELKQQGDCFWLALHQSTPIKPDRRSVIELYNLEMMLKIVRNALGDDWKPRVVHLQCSSLPSGLHAREISSGNIRFSSTMTAIAIPTAGMSKTMSGYHLASDLRVIGNAANTEQFDFATSLRLLLVGYLDEALTMDQCAELVGMSGRTLQRRLAENETTFNELLDQARFDVAKQLLQNDSISVSDVCYEIGYSNPGNFTRAFRRWAGVSPRQHRQLHSTRIAHESSGGVLQV
jgi:AraC-like DNA-binding protein